MFKAVKIEKGKGGWGGPLIILPTEKKNKIVSVTGGGIDELTRKISELTGAEAVDGFSTGVPDDEIACVIVDCGGTARCGVYPKKGVFTVNIMPVGQSGPLAQFIKEDIYVSGVKPDNITLYDGEISTAPSANASDKKTYQEIKAEAKKAQEQKAQEKGGVGAFITNLGKAMGGVVGKFYQAGREAIDITIRNILPFMAFVAMLIGIITKSGLGDVIANTIAPFAGTLPGLLIICIVCCIPIISPILGPGAVIAQVVGTLVGVQIGAKAIPPALALPALFAIDGQAGCDFIPVGLSLGEAEPDTVEIGVPAVMFSRLITGPAAVLIAYAFSFGLYS